MPSLKTQNKIEWHYETFGEGDDNLLFIHGWGVDHRIWNQQIKYFSQNYQVLAIDLPGHGKSGFVNLPLSEMAHDLREVLIHSKMSNFNVVASSLGGLFALRMYELCPKAFQKITFVGSIPQFIKSDKNPHGIEREQFENIDKQLDQRYPAIVDIFFRSLFTDEERATRRFKWIQRFRKEEQAPLKPALREYLEILENEDLTDVLKNVRVPLQFVNGTGDPICTLEAVKDLKRYVPGARFDEFESCGHFPFLTQPNEFNEVVESFLKWAV